MTPQTANPDKPLQNQDSYAINTDLFSVQVDPLDRSAYEGQMEVATLGSLSLANIKTSSAIVARKNEEFSNPDCRRFSFVIVLEGEMILSYHHGVTEVGAGQFLFIDNTYPRSMFVQDSINVLVISLPCIVLQRFFPDPLQHEGLILDSNKKDGSMGEKPWAFILDNWEKIRLGSLREFAPTLTDRLLQQLADSYAIKVNPGGGKQAERIAQAKALIEKRLCDPGFTVEALAQEMKVSSRYLRALFTSVEKISHYIFRRRMEVCAQYLAAPGYADKPISEVAFSCGFCNMAHFCRSFKKHYHVTPREYRKAQIRHDNTTLAGSE